MQKGEYGKHMVEPYCLVHTAGDQQDWVARLELEGESRLDGGDEAGEASDSEVDREVFRANWRNRPSGPTAARGGRVRFGVVVCVGGGEDFFKMA